MFGFVAGGRLYHVLSVNSFPYFQFPDKMTATVVNLNAKMYCVKIFQVGVKSSFFYLLICLLLRYSATKPLNVSAYHYCRQNLCDFPKLICFASSMSTSTVEIFPLTPIPQLLISPLE